MMDLTVCGSNRAGQNKADAWSKDIRCIFEEPRSLFHADIPFCICKRSPHWFRPRCLATWFIPCLLKPSTA